MQIWVTRHGQTDLNKKKLMQGRIDKPLNETGIMQAQSVRDKIGDVTFDAVYASSLDRAITTASIIGNVQKEDVVVDDRIIETDFGKYDCRHYGLMGPAMTAYWVLPEVFHAPKTVESIPDMVKRSHGFLKELEQKGYENVLIVCHGGIIRAIRGYLEDSPKKVVWRPKPKNCEVRIYESIDGKHKTIQTIKADNPAKK